LGNGAASACSVSSLDDWFQQRTMMQSLIQQHIAHAKNHMKMQADKNCTEQSFDVGAWVYVKLQLYVQSSVAARSN
jgi:hypothetical protein